MAIIGRLERQPGNEMSNEFLTGKTLIPAETLTGSRVYSTDLHPNNFDGSELKDAINDAAISLKAKMLTRGLVSINGAHFVSPFGVRFIEEFGDEFLTSEALLTAYRNDHQAGFSAYTSDYRYQTRDLYTESDISDARLASHVKAVDEKVQRILPWDGEGVGERYRKVVLDGLTNEHSIVRARLQSLAGVQTDGLALMKASIEDESLDLTDDGGMYEYLARQPPEVQAVLRPFLTSCYHIVGVGVVNCETGTDLLPMASIKAFEQVTKGLSEPLRTDDLAIFKAFFDVVMKVFDSFSISTFFLEKLSFTDAAALGLKLRRTSFSRRFDEVVAEFAQGLEQKNDQAAFAQLNINGLQSAIVEMERLFDREIRKDINAGYRTAYEEEARGRILSSMRGMATDAIGLVPALGNIVSAYSILSKAPDFVKGSAAFQSTGDAQTAMSNAQKQKVEDITKMIASRKLAGDHVMADLGALLADIATRQSKRL